MDCDGILCDNPIDSMNYNTYGPAGRPFLNAEI